MSSEWNELRKQYQEFAAKSLVRGKELEDRVKWLDAYIEGCNDSFNDLMLTKVTATERVKELEAEREEWLSLAHILCSYLGVPQGRIKDRLLDAQGKLTEMNHG